MKLSMTKVAVGIKEYLLMALGMFMYALGWVGCVIPAGGMGGGATGLSMIFNAIFPAISIGTFVFIINAVLLVVFLIYLSNEHKLKTFLRPIRK